MILDYSTPRNLIIADSQNNRIRKVKLDEFYTTETIAGTGRTENTKDGFALESDLQYPYGLAADKDNNIYFSEPYNRIRKIYKGENDCYFVNTIAGNGVGYVDGNRFQAKFRGPDALALDHNTGDLYIADTNNYCIRVINISPQNPHTVESDMKSLLKSEILSDVSIDNCMRFVKLHQAILDARCVSPLFCSV